MAIGKEIIICKQCGKEEEFYPCQKRNFCSRKCYWKYLESQEPWNKGRKETREEVLAKQSKSHMGLQTGSNNGRYGKSPWNKGLTYTRPEMSREKHWNWRGGFSLNYPIDWTKMLRESIRERDNYCCALCGRLQGTVLLDIHHIDYDKENCNPSNLISLCRSCHMKTNSNGRKRWIKLFNMLLKERNGYRGTT